MLVYTMYQSQPFFLTTYGFRPVIGASYKASKKGSMPYIFSSPESKAHAELLEMVSSVVVVCRGPECPRTAMSAKKISCFRYVLKHK